MEVTPNAPNTPSLFPGKCTDARERIGEGVYGVSGLSQPKVDGSALEFWVFASVREAHAAVQARRIDRLSVASLLSLGRTFGAIHNAVEVLLSMGAQIEVIESGVTLGAPDGEPLRAQLAWAADLQRRASREHVARDGRTGACVGRPPKAVDEACVRALWGEGANQWAMAETLGVSRGTIQRRLSALGLRGRPGALTKPPL